MILQAPRRVVRGGAEVQSLGDALQDRDELVARYVNPRRELVRDSQRFDDKGERRGRRAYSGIPASALSIWADGMQGHMVSQSLRWFRSQLGDIQLNKVDEVRAWLPSGASLLECAVEERVRPGRA